MATVYQTIHSVETGQLPPASHQPRPVPAVDRCQQQQAQQRYLLEVVLRTMQHFFGSLTHWFAGVRDPRASSHITYPLPALLFAGLWLFLCRLGARRQLGLLLRDPVAAANFQRLFDVPNCPHGDTLEQTFRRLNPDQMQAVVCWLTSTLIRQKVLNRERLLERYWLVAIDGTGMLSFPERHCPQCLTRTQNDKTTYYHPVLEAKLVTPSGFAFSLMTEFIENPEPNPTKQDCELKAFYRLSARLKERFARLPLVLLLDGLFAGGPTFDLCRRYGWHYLIVLTDTDLPTINQEFEALTALELQNRLHWRTGQDLEIEQQFRWVNQIEYQDSEQRQHQLNLLECLETKPDQTGRPKTTKFKWLTDLTITATNVKELANQGGRCRWKIENEGFNVQKNGGYNLEHAYTTDYNSAKIFYYLLQIAHLIFQLVDRGNLLTKEFHTRCGSAKNLALRLLEAWRNTLLAADILNRLAQQPCQIRFDTS